MGCRQKQANFPLPPEYSVFQEGMGGMLMNELGLLGLPGGWAPSQAGFEGPKEWVCFPVIFQPGEALGGPCVPR